MRLTAGALTGGTLEPLLWPTAATAAASGGTAGADWAEAVYRGGVEPVEGLDDDQQTIDGTVFGDKDRDSVQHPNEHGLGGDIQTYIMEEVEYPPGGHTHGIENLREGDRLAGWPEVFDVDGLPFPHITAGGRLRGPVRRAQATRGRPAGGEPGGPGRHHLADEQLLDGQHGSTVDVRIDGGDPVETVRDPLGLDGRRRRCGAGKDSAAGAALTRRPPPVHAAFPPAPPSPHRVLVQ